MEHHWITRITRTINRESITLISKNLTCQRDTVNSRAYCQFPFSFHFDLCSSPLPSMNMSMDLSMDLPVNLSNPNLSQMLLKFWVNFCHIRQISLKIQIENFLNSHRIEIQKISGHPVEDIYFQQETTTM